MTLSLIINAYNRPEYLSRCFGSVLAANLGSVTRLVVVDDASTQYSAVAIIDDFVKKAPVANCYLIRRKTNGGIKSALRDAINFVLPDSDVIINLDGDALVKPNFIDRIIEVMNMDSSHKMSIVTGFNCVTKNRDGSERHKILVAGDGFNIKESVGGVNMAYSADTAKNVVLPALETCIQLGGNWDYVACKRLFSTMMLRPVCVVPSVVQHIGVESSMGHSEGGEPPDVADDFDEPAPLSIAAPSGKLFLPDVTLVCVDCFNVGRARHAIEKSMSGIEFGKVVLLTSLKTDFEYAREIRHIGSKAEYSVFMMKELAAHIETPYLLVVQHDGFVVNPHAWNPEWKNYDYIGAPWLWYKNGQRVGNGGFSFRTKRLHDILAEDESIVPKNEIGVTQNMEEDHCICRLYGSYLTYKYGVRFAPESEASAFSIEAWGVKPPLNKYSGQFGFHGGSVDFGNTGIK